MQAINSQDVTLAPFTYYYKEYQSPYAPTLPAFLTLIGDKGKDLVAKHKTQLISFHFDSPATLANPAQCRSCMGVACFDKAEELETYLASLGLSKKEFKNPCMISKTDYAALNFPNIMAMITSLDKHILSAYPEVASYIDIDGLPYMVFFEETKAAAYAAPIGEQRVQYAICTLPMPELNEKGKEDFTKRLSQRTKK